MRLGYLAFAILALAPAAAAQTTVTLMHDNDEWASSDWEYAQGSRLSVISREWGGADWAQIAARALPGIEAGETLSAGFGATHQFFTPPFLNSTLPVSNQRSYGALLEGSVLLQSDTWNRLDTWRFDLGVVGPSAQGEELEEFFHNIFNGRPMLGWDNQIRDRLALNASWERRWRNLMPVVDRLSVDLSPAIGLEAGAVSTAASAGLTLRFGRDLEGDFGPPRVQAPGGSLHRSGSLGWSAYAFVSANAKYVAYDVFLDEPGGRSGDPVRAGSAITRDNLRTELSYGLVLAHGGTRLSFAMTEQPKLHDQQLDDHRWGEVTLGFSF